MHISKIVIFNTEKYQKCYFTSELEMCPKYMDARISCWSISNLAKFTNIFISTNH